MKLKRFIADGIHGFLNFDVKFDGMLTFLTGINGSGKTTAINAIVAIITPDLSILADLEYNTIELHLEHNGKDIRISSINEEKSVVILVNIIKDPFVFNKYIRESETPANRQADAEVEHYRDLIASKSDQPVLRLLASLPSPMFLGLDRRARYEEDVRRNRYLMRNPRAGRNIFGSSLARGLLDAADIAETRFRDALIASGQIAENLQREMLLNLITVSPEEHSDFASLSVPSAADRREIERVRRDLDTLSQILHLPHTDVRGRVSPFLDLLERLASRIPMNANIEELLGSDSRHSEVLNSIIQWSNNHSHLRRIKIISDTVSKYTRQRYELMQPIQNFLSLVNQFFEDSGKRILFGDRGYIYIDIDGIQEEKNINYLSSGEAQIFVILTHLSFHPLAAKDNVFIIDEPELSLHVQWQELFVDSIISANPHIQYVLATHSPSIILDRIRNCVDVSRKHAKARRGRKG
ncbi:AAA family ATPase [Aquibium oceanicum]|uniref:AAA+ ATPase domain-containing protein n=1 Tax=Aquibium oceanicum TaxID=1670800 RepID=A0A1L3SNA2_9HYPH|nr:AAA family ATPase [Aquibium oceanicum]APH70883.1 hypothetical protein BSQ44_05450 [Aquibium oceanicum]